MRFLIAVISFPLDSEESSIMLLNVLKESFHSFSLNIKSTSSYAYDIFDRGLVPGSFCMSSLNSIGLFYHLPMMLI